MAEVFGVLETPCFDDLTPPTVGSELPPWLAPDLRTK